MYQQFYHDDTRLARVVTVEGVLWPGVFGVRGSIGNDPVHLIHCPNLRPLAQLLTSFEGTVQY